MKAAALACALLASALFSACSSPLVKPVAGTPARAAVVEVAGAQVGVPYKYGGTDRHGFDASGLVYFSYREAGFEVPKNTHGQLRAGRLITFHQCQPADLLFYRLSPKQSGSDDGLHVGIYMGNGEMVHAPLDRDEVVRETVDNPYWLQRFVNAVRFLP